MEFDLCKGRVSLPGDGGKLVTAVAVLQNILLSNLRTKYKSNKETCSHSRPNTQAQEHKSITKQRADSWFSQYPTLPKYLLKFLFVLFDVLTFFFFWCIE
ncbi:hypothetical protein J1N35_045217 [Gossypium stocksii]|uniref:Uncharacterized protein n=1 Tax=Gossypium stocksii TaxID=47602 RepID=A0A9D3UAL4_9ROSI|nr:hypothetical protein J1N35_045217 [Gossypium stocksii]